MNTKLTLTIDQSIIEKAKKYARTKDRSLSGLIENYLRALVDNNENKSGEKLTPTVKSLRGAFKAPKNFNYKKELTESLSNKYM